MPAERPTIGARIARVALALFLFFGTTTLMELLVASLGYENTELGAFVTGFVPPFVYLLGTVHIGAALGVYWKRNRTARAHLQFVAQSLPVR